MRTLAALLVLAAAAAAQELDPVGGAMADLRSEDYEAREDAMRRLEDLGERAVPALEAAAREPDPDLQRRVGTVLSTIRLRRLDRDGVWPALAGGNPWRDTLAFAGATIQFRIDGSGAPSAWWVLHGSGEPIVSQEELPVALELPLPAVHRGVAGQDVDAGGHAAFH